MLQLSPKVGFNPTELADSLYHVESSFKSTGISAQKAMDILKIGAEGAKVGNSNLVDTQNALDAAIVSGIPGVQNFQQAMGALNKIVGSGDMSMQDLTEAFGTGAVAVVKNYGLSLNDVGAVLATFGDNNIRGAEAGTQMRMSVTALTKATPAGVKNLKELGITQNQLATDMQHGGLNKAMQDLVGHMDKAGITGNKVGQFITDTFGKKVGAGLGILVGQFDRFESKEKEVADGASGFAAAWAHTNDTTKQKLAELTSAWDVLLVQAGTKILPTIKDIADELSRHPAILKDTAIGIGILGTAWAALKLDGLIRSFAALSAEILGVGTASATAAGETEAANLGGAAAGAAGKARGVSGVARVVIPLAIAYEVVSAIGEKNTIDDIIHGQFQKAEDDAPKWSHDLSLKIRSAFSNSADISGTVASNFTVKPAAIQQTEQQIDKLKKLLADPFNKSMASSPFYAGLVTQLRDAQLKLADLNKQQTLTAATTAVDAFHKGLAALAPEIVNNDHALTGNSQAAIVNRSAITVLAEKAKDAAAAYAASTGKTADYRGALLAALPAIDAQAQALGLNVGQVDALTRGILGLPPGKSIPVSTPGANAALNTANALATTLANMPRLVPISIQVATTSLASQFSDNASVLAAKGNIPFLKAAGGLIRGPGTGTSDSIPAWLSDYEYVMPADRVKQLGVGFFDAIRSGVKMPSFAAGGVALNSAEKKYLSSLSQQSQFAGYLGGHPEVAKYLEGLKSVATYLKSVAAATAAMTTKLTTFVQQQQAYRDSLKSTVTSGGTISDLLAQSGNAGDLKQLFAGKIGDIQAFASKVAALKKAGWPDAIVREIASDGIGPGTQYADLLLNASKSDTVSLIGASNTLTGLQLGTSNSITALTGGTAGLTMPSVLSGLNSAALNAGNTTAAIAKATAAQVKANYAPAPLIHNENVHINSNVDLQLMAKQASFLQSAGHFG